MEARTYEAVPPLKCTEQLSVPMIALALVHSVAVIGFSPEFQLEV